MATADFFKEVFDALATDGYIGNPQGKLAYCYLRVSSAGQAEEGRSGLPRQIMHVHEAASQYGLKIPWELVFADDHTGFEFKDRPELGRLRSEYRKTNRQAHAVVMEYLDRLSRNADWHQGFLLEEMRQYGVEVVFWKAFASRIERAVMGAISQEGMEQAKQRMAEGNIYKAKDGRVTARVAAYGYRLVDSEGREGERAKKDSHYAIEPEEAEVIRLIYTKVGVEGWSTRKLAAYLEDRFPPPKNSAHWEATLITLLLRKPLYKGEFIAHRHYEAKVPSTMTGPDEPVRLVKRKIQRPPEEWIRVSVPAIVSPELWDMANQMLAKNAQTGRRNAKRPYLLTGLIRCASCGYSYTGGRRSDRQNGKVYEYSIYRCSSRSQRLPQISQKIACPQGETRCHFVDDAVWSAVCRVLLEPEILIQALERNFAGGENAHLREEIAFLERQVKERNNEDEKLYRAYQADVFDEHEYAARRRLLKESRQKLLAEIEQLRSQVITEAQLEERKRMVREMAASAPRAKLIKDASFEDRQRIIKLVVDRVVLNVNEGWCRIEGAVGGLYPVPGNDEIENISMGMGSSRQ